MASQPVPEPSLQRLQIPDSLRQSLHVQETDTHYIVETFSGAKLFRPRSDVKYAWELLEGVYDDGKDTDEERRRARDVEVAGDAERYGV